MAAQFSSNHCLNDSGCSMRAVKKAAAWEGKQNKDAKNQTKNPTPNPKPTVRLVPLSALPLP